jgi:tripartite-type tricarboxylate transporter receptor subunit TctC
MRFFHPPSHRLAMLASSLLAAILLSTGASAETPWPSRPIKLIVPYAAGGGTDIIARAVATKLAKRLGQPLIVDNKPGGGGILGFDTAARASADGYTLLFVTTAFSTIASAGRKLPYDPAKDFVAIGEIGATPLLVVVAQDSPIKTLRDLVDQARAKPNSVTYGSSGIGSMSHLGMELLDSIAHVQMLHVPYKGMAPVLTDLLGGNVKTALCTFASAASFIKAGKLRGVVVTSTQRTPFAPNVPTSTEAGFPDFRIEFWWGLMAPSRVPPAVVKRVNEELNAILAEGEVRELLANEAAIPTPTTPESFSNIVSSDTTRWTKLIKEGNIQVE